MEGKYCSDRDLVASGVWGTEGILLLFSQFWIKTRMICGSNVQSPASN